MDLDHSKGSYPLPNYTPYHAPNVSVYLKNDLHTTILATDLLIDNSSFIITQLHPNKYKTNPIHTIINLYRNPNRPPTTTFTKDLQKMIDFIHTKAPTTSLTIQGDINLNLFKQPIHFYNFLTLHGLLSTITTPTRYDNYHNSYSLIDASLSTLTHMPCTAGTLTPPITDHLPTLTIFHTQPPRKTKNYTKTLSRNRYEKEKEIILPDITTAIKNLDNNHDNANEAFHELQTTISSAIKRHTKRSKSQPRWLSQKHKRLIHKQRKLHKLRLQRPTQQNIKKHAAARNHLRRTILKAKRADLKKNIDEAKTDSTKLAKVLRSVLPSNTNTRTSPTTITDYNGNTHTEPLAIANALNDHYITIGARTAQTIPVSHQPPPATQQPNNPSFKLKPFTQPEVEAIMKNINRNKASDIYDIKPAIIKDLTPTLAPILTKLYNQCITNNEYPDSLKLTKVIEIYKAKDKTLPANYRPISLLPILAKIFDTLLNNQLMKHLLDNNILSPTQYAFRPSSSTTLALQSVLNNIHANIKDKCPTLAIYVDLSKAYDTISHANLIHKLRTEFNFSPYTTKFFASYFNNRKQSTHTQHAQSDVRVITHGIPQGSTLSTTFFNLYINNIIKTVIQSKVYTYADDTTLVITAKNVAELQSKAQDELNRLITYFHSNNLVPNPTKTNYTVFHPIALPANFDLNIGDTTLTHNLSAKLLGIYIEQKLKYKHTITHIIKKLQPTIRALKYAARLLPTANLINLYKSLVYPHLIYAITVWGTDNPKATYMQPIIKTQKKILRIITKNHPRAPTKPIRTKYDLLSVTNLYIQRVCNEIHPFIHQCRPTNRPEHQHEYRQVSEFHHHATRYSTNALATHARTTTTGTPFSPAFFTTTYSIIWTAIPRDIRDEKRLGSFKRKLKAHLLSLQRAAD